MAPAPLYHMTSHGDIIHEPLTTMTGQTSSSAITAFRYLHKSGCFVMPNPWDAGSARMLYHLGFKALASTSAGFAFSIARADSATSLHLGEVLNHLTFLVKATPLPLNADFQNGYADAPEGVFDNVMRCVRTGVAGLSIEDSTGDAQKPLYDSEFALERIRAARAAIDAAGSGTLLTARCEAFLVGARDPYHVALERLVAFAAAGADCLYAPGITDLKQIAEMVQAVAPKPINVLVARPMPGLTVSTLADLGVRRISLGSALSRLALGSTMQAAKLILETGQFESLDSAVPFADLNRIFLDQ